jgi:hypothetical protein
MEEPGLTYVSVLIRSMQEIDGDEFNEVDSQIAVAGPGNVERLKQVKLPDSV